MACCSSKPKARRQQAPGGHADGAIAAAWSDGTDIGNQGTTVEYVSEDPFASDMEPSTSEASQLFGPTPTGCPAQDFPRPEDAAVPDTGGTSLPPPSKFNPRHPLEETGNAERQVLTLSPADASGGTVPSAGGGAAAGTMSGQQQQQQQQQLSAGWEERRTETGEIYYWNRDTDESTWDRPQQQAVALQEGAGAEAATEAAAKRLAEMEAAAAAEAAEAEKEAQQEIEAQRKQAEAQSRAEAAAKRRVQLQEAHEQQRLQQQRLQQQQQREQQQREQQRREQQQQQQQRQQQRQQQQPQQQRPPHQDRHTTADRGSSTSPAAEAERMRLLRARQQQQQQLLVQSGPKPSRTAIAGLRSTAAAAAAAAAAPLSSSLSPGGSSSSSRKARQPLETLEADKTSRTEWWQPGAEEGGEQGRLRDLLTRCALASTDPQGALVRATQAPRRTRHQPWHGSSSLLISPPVESARCAH
jgi:hypothetical protein